MSKLNGILEICEYLKVSESTAMAMIHHQSLPAVTKDGIWLSDTTDIDKWQRINIGSKTGPDKKKAGKSGPKATRKSKEK